MSKKISKEYKWMKQGIPVKYKPVFFPSGKSGNAYSGILAGAPFQIGNPTNERWVVRIEQMDERYQKDFGRTVEGIAGVKYVTPILPQIREV